MGRILLDTKQEKLEEINRQAAVLFATLGYANTSMKQIALAMGIEAPSLYNHIKSKTELLKNICFGISVKFEQNLALMRSKKSSPLIELESIVRFHVQLAFADVHALYVANHEWKHLPDKERKQFVSSRNQYEDRLVEILQQAIDQKQIKPANARMAALIMLSALRGIEFYSKNNSKQKNTLAENEILAQLFYGIFK